MKYYIPYRCVIAVFAAMMLIVGCQRNQSSYVPSPAPEVTVGQPEERDVTNYAEFTGNTVAFATVDLRARVKGFLQSFHFKAGSRVKKGDLLFVIEPDPYQAQVDQAKADLAAKEAANKAAESDLAIKQEMFSKNAASKLDVINATDRRDTTKAQIDVARATLKQAEITFGYTHIYAPLDGRIDRNLVDVGNLVGAGEDTLLATIVQDDPMYAYFNVSERELLEYMAIYDKSKATKDEKIPLHLGLATEEGCPHEGEIDFVSNRLDPDTGTIQLRGIFSNKDGALLSGLFVRVRVPTLKEHALLVPDTALSDDQNGKFLLTVNDKNVVEYRPVKVGALFEGMRAIREGLARGDWVIVNGLQRARPGSPVNAQRQQPSATPGPGAAPSEK